MNTCLQCLGSARLQGKLQGIVYIDDIMIVIILTGEKAVNMKIWKWRLKLTLLQIMYNKEEGKRVRQSLGQNSLKLKIRMF